MVFVPLRVAAKKLGLCKATLRKYADAGKIKSIRTPANQRLFDIESFIGTAEKAVICYCRVSSAKQKDDLARQVTFMRNQFPEAEIIQDVGSGLNFKRKGLRSILERALRGAKLTVVAAHRDRLARFGFELIEFVIKQAGGEVMVLDRILLSPEEELTKDLLEILHVFSCRLHGLRRYSTEIEKDPNLSKQDTTANLQKMVRSTEICLQQNGGTIKNRKTKSKLEKSKRRCSA